MKRALWPCRWQVNAHAVSNVSSPSSLWLETSWRALSDKMHFPSQTSFLHSGWFLALAANAPNLWCQFYFRFYFCQQCCVLEFDFAPHSVKICRLPSPTLSLPSGSQEQGDAWILTCRIPYGLLYMTQHTTVGTTDWTSFSATCYHDLLCACFHTGCFLVFFSSCMQREQLEKAFFLWVGESYQYCIIYLHFQ